jgi:mRNA interferase RelE/StbE
MNFEFKKSFLKDLKKRSKDAGLRSRVQEIIQEVEKADSIHDISDIKKLKAEGNFYRIRFGDYRVGIIVEDNIVFFVRVLHRSDIYKYFP